MERMMKNIKNKDYRIIVFFFSAILLFNFMVSTENGESKEGSEDGEISLTTPVGRYDIKETQKGHNIEVEGFGLLMVPGKPALIRYHQIHLSSLWLITLINTLN